MKHFQTWNSLTLHLSRENPSWDSPNLSTKKNLIGDISRQLNYSSTITFCFIRRTLFENSGGIDQIFDKTIWGYRICDFLIKDWESFYSAKGKRLFQYLIISLPNVYACVFRDLFWDHFKRLEEASTKLIKFCILQFCILHSHTIVLTSKCTRLLLHYKVVQQKSLHLFKTLKTLRVRRKN